MKTNTVKRPGNIFAFNKDPFSFMKALLLCFFIDGILFVTVFIFDSFQFLSDIIGGITYCAVVIAVIAGMGKNELQKILVWKNVPLPVFSGLFIMFSGLIILYIDLCRVVAIIIPVPDDFWSLWYNTPDNVFLAIMSMAIFPGFTEELFFRGFILRRFSRTYSPLKALLLSSVLFGIMHFNPWQAITTTFMGIFFGWLYRRYKSIWLCMLLHAYNNVLALYMLYPTVRRYNTASYTPMEFNPLWFNFLGLTFFGLGLLTVIVLDRERKNIENSPCMNKV